MSPKVIAALGGRRVFGIRAARIDLLDEVERGLPRRAYAALSTTLKLTPEEKHRLLRTTLSARTPSPGRARLDLDTSDRLVRLARILALAISVLETRKNALAWLRNPSKALGGRSPLTAAGSDPGAEKVSNMLYQMEHGIHS